MPTMANKKNDEQPVTSTNIVQANGATTNGSGEANKVARALAAAQAAKNDAQAPAVNSTAEGTAPAVNGAKTPKPKPEFSPKAKASRGVAEHLVTTWVPVDNEPAFNDMLRQVAKARNTTVVKVYQDIIAEVMTPDRIKGLEAEAATAPEPKAKAASLENKTPEQLEATMAKAQKQLDLIRAKMAELKKSKETPAA